MSQQLSVDELWQSTSSSDTTWSGAPTDWVEPARRYLDHSLAVGAHLPGAVRIEMHGEIKLGRWFPFQAEQVIVAERGMIWAATVRLFGLPIRGSDRIVDGVGAMRWKLLGFIPIVNDSSPDVTRSAIGRLGAELIWLPSALAKPGVTWTSEGPKDAHARFELDGESLDLALTVEPDGRASAVTVQRWGLPPEARKYGYFAFGGAIDEVGTFDGLTVPTRLRIGWYAGTEQFETDGEFIRVSVDGVQFR